MPNLNPYPPNPNQVCIPSPNRNPNQVRPGCGRWRADRRLVRQAAVVGVDDQHPLPLTLTLTLTSSRCGELGLDKYAKRLAQDAAAPLSIDRVGTFSLGEGGEPGLTKAKGTDLK